MIDLHVNPVHFKPTWLFVRMPDESDEIKAAFGDSCLALSDAEMIAMRVALSTFVSVLSQDLSNRRTRKIVSVIEAINEKLKSVLAIEFWETVE